MTEEESLMVNDSTTLRRELLSAWYAAWQQKHNAILACARVKVPVRVGGRMYFLTPERAIAAAAQTFEELYIALEAHPDWGVGPDGLPSELAMRGLIMRRLRSRVQDQLRARRDEEDSMPSLDEPVGSGGDGSAGDFLGSTRVLDDFETMDALRRALHHETRETRAAVLLKLAGEDGPQIAERLGLAPATVRQRLHRFKVRRGLELKAA